MRGMTSTGKNGPQDAPQSRSQAKASRREQMRQEMLRRQAAEQRKARLRTAGVVALVVVIGVAIAVGLTISINGKKDDKAAPSGPAPASVISAITGVSSSVIDAVGKGSSSASPSPLSGAPALTADGKPRVLYVGAEFCPYCAAERWSVVNALSRFGTFTGLGQTSSSSSDVYPNTPTLSFHGATYKSDYLSFTGVEQTDRDKQPLDTLSSADAKIFSTYNPQGGIPFIDYGGTSATSGAGYDPGILQGKTHQQIAAALSDPSSDITKAIIGQANVVTATLCQLTDQKPATVCDAAGVKAAA
jgi:hypothetical protein